MSFVVLFHNIESCKGHVEISFDYRSFWCFGCGEKNSFVEARKDIIAKTYTKEDYPNDPRDDILSPNG